MNRLYRSQNEYDRLENAFRCTYVLINSDGYVFLVNLEESMFRSLSDIQNAKTCWKSVVPFKPENADMKFVRDRDTLELNLSVQEDVIVVEDRNQDEWGGFGGTYKRAEI